MRSTQVNDTRRANLGSGRIGRAQALMADHDLDALFIATGTNLCYLTGYPMVEATLARPFYLVLPRRGEPVLVVHTGRVEEARRFGWVDDVRPYSRLSVAPVDELVRAFKDAGIDGGRIGAEIGREQRLGMPVLEFDRLRHALPRLEFTDGADLLWRLRMVKTDAEVAAIAKACAITGDAYEDTFRMARRGVRDRLVARHLETAMTDRGGLTPWVLVTSGPGNYGLATGVPLDRDLELGDMLWFDAGCQVGGFWSDFSRAGVVGMPSPGQLELHAAISEVTSRGVEAVLPGLTTGELGEAVVEWTHQLVGDGIVSTSEQAGRVGHGVGFDVTEPPHLAPGDPTVLEPGMVITIEPGITTVDGLYHVEQVVAVTPDGHRLLSECPMPLRSISVA